MQEVVREVFLDDVLLVACADDEFVVAVVAVQLHDVPEDGHPPQLHHGLGLELGFFADAGPEPAGQDDDFHGLLLPL